MSQKNIDGSLGFLLNKGTQVLHRELNRNFTAKGYDITHEQWSTLAFLYHCDGKSQNEIAEKTHRDKVSVTKIVDNLEKRDLVYRAPDDKDRRVKRIFITASGFGLIPKLKEIVFETLEEGFSGIKNRDLDTFKLVLSEIVKNITGEDLLKFIKINKEKWKQS
jgi:DNA-binding MarR family transcriptional regulator